MATGVSALKFPKPRLFIKKPACIAWVANMLMIGEFNPSLSSDGRHDASAENRLDRTDRFLSCGTSFLIC
ncbi:MAG: hypothetical protein Q7K13_07895 [Polynucleobacter sp.]|uniref:hypothetical protein n=1 Tax=Polynucleobacter sp. TaxID=2029855 RepID=UPI0027261883|nr:hypothetical protein [Polynucleobacter sp.]MDO8714384.1 hypothetical protein [Polynucleobacter sp.]